MQERYYYCQGFCETLSLNSLNPILYQGEGDAPEMMEDDGANMVKTKYHAV